MKSFLPILMILCVSGGVTSRLTAAPGEPATPASLASAPPAPVPEIPTEARRLALETAGAFTNDGFRIRDGAWNVSLEKGVSRFLRVTLFSGNRYWFVAASPGSGLRLRVTVYDAEGKVVKGEVWQDPDGRGRSAAGVAPVQSGEYFVGVESTEAPAGVSPDACLIIAYQ